jgi:hypothetical protein
MWGERRNRTELIELLRRAVTAGVDLVEIVAGAGPVAMEDLVREALAPYPPGLMLAWRTGPVRPELVLGALDRLGVRQVDLLVVPASRRAQAQSLVESGSARRIALAFGDGQPSSQTPDPATAIRSDRALVWADGIHTPMIAPADLSELDGALIPATPPAAGPG